MHLWTLLAGACRANTRVHLPWGEPTEYTFEQVLDRAERSAVAVQRALGRTPRRLGLLMNNGEPWLRGLLAAARLDAAAVPLALPVAFGTPDAYRTHLGGIARDAGLDAVLVDATTASLTGVVRGAADGLAVVDVQDPPDVRPKLLEPSGGDDDLAVVQYTSGSTSHPKGVALSHACVTAGLPPITTDIDWTGDDVMGLWLPLFHDMGLFSMLASLARGSSVCLWSPRDFVKRTRAWLKSFAASPATVSPSPNFAYGYLAQAYTDGLPGDLDLSGWRVAFNGAEPVQQRTIDAFTATFERAGFRAESMLPVYGLAEATLAAAFPPLHRRPRVVTVDREALGAGGRVHFVTSDTVTARAIPSVGRAVTGLRLRIASGSTPVADDTVGEIQLKGAAVMRGYLNVPDAEQPFTADRWLRTGDLAFRHDGETFVVGRLKDMIIVRGQNYYAEDVEEIVAVTPGLDRRHCVATGWHGDGTESILVLFETALTGADALALAETVRASVTSGLGVGEVRVVPVSPRSIPYTSSGKVKRRAAQALFERNQLDDGSHGQVMRTGVDT